MFKKESFIYYIVYTMYRMVETLISIRIKEEDLFEIDQAAQKEKRSRSNFMIKCALDKAEINKEV